MAEELEMWVVIPIFLTPSSLLCSGRVGVCGTNSKLAAAQCVGVTIELRIPHL